MATDANFDHLDPKIQPLAKAFLFQCNKLFETKIIVTWRDPADQDKCKAEGLSKAGAGQSPHNCTLPDGTPASRAFDFAIFIDGNYLADGSNYRYTLAGAIWKVLGQTWGGDFSHPDYDHCELSDWASSSKS